MRRWKSIENEAGSRFRHSSFSFNEYIYIFGGENFSEKEKFFFKYNTKTEEWNSLKMPEILSNGIQNCTCNVYKNQVYILCGVDNSLSHPNDQVICFNLITEEWKNYKLKNHPNSRYLHTTSLYQDSLFLFGGYFFKTFDDLFELNLQKMKFEKIDYKGDISRRFNHNSIVFKDSMYIYGGYSLEEDTPDRTIGSKYNNDLMEYDFKTQYFRKLISNSNVKPIPRWGSTSCLYKNEFIMFGGSDDEYVDLNDMFIYDFRRFEWKKIEADNIPWMRW